MTHFRPALDQHPSERRDSDSTEACRLQSHHSEAAACDGPFSEEYAMQSSSKYNPNMDAFTTKFRRESDPFVPGNFVKEASTGGAGAPLCVSAINMLLYVVHCLNNLPCVIRQLEFWCVVKGSNLLKILTTNDQKQCRLRQQRARQAATRSNTRAKNLKTQSSHSPLPISEAAAGFAALKSSFCCSLPSLS